MAKYFLKNLLKTKFKRRKTMNNKRRLSPIIIALVLVMILSVVPVFAFTSGAEAEDNKVTVKFYADDKTGYFDSVTVDAGTEITLPAVPELDGYEALGWVKEEVQITTEEPEYLEAGNDVVVDADTNFYALYSQVKAGSAGGASGIYKLHTGDVTPGNYLIVDKGSKGAVKAAISSSRLAYTTVSITNDTITEPAADLVWEFKQDGSSWNFYNAKTAKYMASTGAKNKAALESSVTAKGKWTIEVGSSTYELINDANKAAKVNCNLRKNDTYGFATYATGTGAALTLYKEQAASSADVTYYTTGTVTEKYFVNFVAPNGIEVASQTFNEATAYTLPVIDVPADYADAFEFAGWATATIDGETTTAPKLYTTYTATADVTFYAVFRYVVSASGGTEYALATAATTFASGDQVVIAAKDANNALSTNQKSNNRGAAAITKDGNTITFGDDVQVLTLAAGTTTGTFAFDTGDGYLGTASGGNYLRTQANINADSSFTIDINESGVASIVAKSSTYNKVMQYNPNPNGDPLFSCYSSASQKALVIYKLSENATYGYVTTLPEIEVEPKISAANLTLGADLTVNYYATLPEGTENAKMVFTFNEKTYEVTEWTVADDGRYVFAFEGIAPQCMKDNIAADLYIGDELVDTKAEYSVYTYAMNKLAEENATAELKALLNNMLNYGAEAQLYTGYNVDDLANEGVEVELAAPTEAELTRDVTEKLENAYFTAAGVNFDYTNKIYAKFTVADGTDFTVTVNGKEAEVEKIGDKYIVYTDAITAKNFTEAATFVLTVGDASQTLTYSINDYVYAMKGDDAMADLALALYNYGVAAKAYAAN